MTIQHSGAAAAQDGDAGRAEILHDESAWPQVSVTWPPDFDEADLQSHIGRVQGYLGRGPFTLLFDVTAARALTSVERQQFVTFFDTNQVAVEAHCRGVAYISPHKIHRGILTAIQWFVKMPFPLRMFASREDGLDWLRTLEP